MGPRYRLARRPVPRFRLRATSVAREPPPDSSPTSDLAEERLPPVHCSASPPGQLFLHHRQSRARAPAPHLPCPHPRLHSPPQSPAARLDDQAFPLPGLCPSSSLAPTTTDVSAPTADRVGCADTPAPAATRGETLARIFARLDAGPRRSPESRQRQSADCLSERIPQTTRYISSSNKDRKSVV